MSSEPLPKVSDSGWWLPGPGLHQNVTSEWPMSSDHILSLAKGPWPLLACGKGHLVPAWLWLITTLCLPDEVANKTWGTLSFVLTNKTWGTLSFVLTNKTWGTLSFVLTNKTWWTLSFVLTNKTKVDSVLRHSKGPRDIGEYKSSEWLLEKLTIY